MDRAGDRGLGLGSGVGLGLGLVLGSLARGGGLAFGRIAHQRRFDGGLGRGCCRLGRLGLGRAGLDRGARAGLSSRLSKAGPDAVGEDRDKAVRRWETLRAFDKTGLSEAGVLNYAIAAFGRETAAETARFAYGAGPGRPSPYVVGQLSGAYFEIPDFLDNQHRVEDAAGADAFLVKPVSPRALATALHEAIRRAAAAT